MTKQTDAVVKNSGNLPLYARIENVPLVKQKRNHCGPAALAMVMKHLGSQVSITDITSQMFTEKMQGTFQGDMLSTVRRQGLLAIKINNLEMLLKEISADHPVVVFQNLGFSWLPKWHFSVVTGHDINGPDILLHTGGEKFKRIDMRLFERSWGLGGNWGLLVLRPDQLSATASEWVHVDAAARLEDIGKKNEAKLAYQTILERWPQSLGALIGLGNVMYSNRQFSKAVAYLKTAVHYHPKSTIAWHNLKTAIKATSP